MVIALLQFGPKLRQLDDNARRIAAAARAADADLLITPELSLTGYDLRDDAHEVGRRLLPGAAATDVFGSDFAGRTVLLGAVEQSSEAVPYNAAVLVQDGVIAHVQRKVYLPTYGMFDEGRYFGSGRRIDTFALADTRFGILICEDFWHPMLAYLQALQGADVLIVMAAAPGRGVVEGGEAGGFFSSSDAWERIARTYAQLYGVYVAVCNRVGVEGGVTFAGESFVVAPDTSVIARAGIDEEQLTFSIDRDAIKAARTPYAHIRDEDAAFAIGELQRITGR